MAEMVRARIRVRGMVQGVGYRYFVRNEAKALGLSGFVKNKPDGSVEIVAEGERGLVDSLIGKLRVGPHYASVGGLDIQWEEPTGQFGDFDYAF
jgi:acylphosphatase